MIDGPLQVAGCFWAAWGIIWMIPVKNTQKTESAETPAARWQHLVPVGVVFWLIFSPQKMHSWRSYSPLIRWAGTILTGIGLSFAVWARHHLGRYWSGIITLKEGHRIIRTGPYSIARHPIYTGFLAGVLGAAVAGGRLRDLVAFVLALAVYLRKIKREEAFLVERFGTEYQRYRSDIGALLPHWPR
jgi:protein-S-isoprenylcysteine O-methyltransferase Ste14